MSTGPALEEPVEETYRRRVNHGYVDIEVTGPAEEPDVPAYNARVVEEENSMTSVGDEITVSAAYLDSMYEKIS